MAYPRVPVAKTSAAISVLVADTVVLPARPSRIETTIVNDGANVVYLMLQTAVATPIAIASQGIRLSASGGSWTSNSFTGAVNAIAVGGTSIVTVVDI